MVHYARDCSCTCMSIQDMEYCVIGSVCDNVCEARVLGVLYVPAHVLEVAARPRRGRISGAVGIMRFQ